MRASTILLTASLVLVAFGIQPAQASAPCDETTIGFSEGSVTVRDDCTLDVRVNMTCAPPSHTTIDRNLGGHHVRLSVCDGGVGLPPLTVMPGCTRQYEEFEGPFGTNRVEQHHNCRVDVTLNEGIICLGGAVGQETLDVQGSTVTYYYCENPDQGGDLGLGASGPTCAPSDKTYGNYLRVQRAKDCGTDAHLGGYMACLWGTETHTVGAWPATVSFETCRSYPPASVASAASAAPTCEAVGGDAVSDDCKTVSIRPYECVWGGSWHYHTTKPVAVREYRCSSPPEDAGATSATSASSGPAPECYDRQPLVDAGVVEVWMTRSCTLRVEDTSCEAMDPCTEDVRNLDPGHRDVYLPKTQCNKPAVGGYERVADTEYVTVYAWMCRIP